MSRSSDSANPAAQPASAGRDLLLLAVVFGVLFFFRLGSYPLSNPDEGRYAEVPREMLATGDFITPRLDGVNYFEKPPLVYWVTAGMEAVFGLNEWAVRAVPALFSLWGILLTYTAARKLYGREAGLASAIVLGTSLLWFIIGHIPLLDTAVSVFMAWALFAFIRGVSEPAGPARRWQFYQLYLAMALATLTKGLMGFLVTGAVMFFWLLLFNQWKRLRPLYLPGGAVLFLVLTLPWHILAALHNPTWAHRYLYEEHFGRFLTDTASRPGPPYYFVGIVLAGLVPWTGFLWPAARAAVRGGWARRTENAFGWFFLTWAGFIFLFFSASKSKLAPYILPIFPALAVIVGTWIAQAVRATDGSARVRWGLRVFAFINGLLAVALLVIVLRPDLVRLDPPQAAALQLPVFMLAAVLITGGVLTPWRAQTHGARAGFGGILGTTLAMLLILPFALSDTIPKVGTRKLALWVKEHARPEDRVFHCYDFYQDFTFYAERTVGVIGGNVAELELKEDAAARASGRFISDTELGQQWLGPGRIFLVVRRKKLADVKGDYARAYLQWKQKADAARGRALTEAPPERPVFSNPDFHPHLIVENEEYSLYSNQP